MMAEPFSCASWRMTLSTALAIDSFWKPSMMAPAVKSATEEGAHSALSFLPEIARTVARSELSLAWPLPPTTESQEQVLLAPEELSSLASTVQGLDVDWVEAEGVGAVLDHFVVLLEVRVAWRSARRGQGRQTLSVSCRTDMSSQVLLARSPLSEPSAALRSEEGLTSCSV